MKHPTGAITRDIRTRRAKRPGQAEAALLAEQWPESVRVGELMTRAPATIRWDATVDAAWKLMRARRIRHLPVLDHTGHLVGIVTDRDLRHAVLGPALREVDRLGPETVDAARVRDVMTWSVVTANADPELRQAARLLYERRIGALPVVERGRVVGILTEVDVIRAFARMLGDTVLSKPARWGLEA